MIADLFPSGRGRPSVPADVVATVLLLQALQGLSDREAVEALTFDQRKVCARSKRRMEARQHRSRSERPGPAHHSHRGSQPTLRATVMGFPSAALEVGRLDTPADPPGMPDPVAARVTMDKSWTTTFP